MDAYTEKTQAWLDRRYREVDREGVYFAHQPIYGFRRGHSEAWPTVRYIITLQIMRALAHFRFGSLLDVGGSEGYKSALARKLFGAQAYSCDLSGEACRRARAIYDLAGEAVDIHALPFTDGQFDVVLCSETLEHVSRLEDATRELLRVARHAVIITVPHEPVEEVERNIREQVPHGHIHALDPSSFDFARPTARQVVVRKMLAGDRMKLYSAADGMTKPLEGGNSPRAFVHAYNLALPLVRAVLGQSAVERMIDGDAAAAEHGPSYWGMLFMLIKDESAYSAAPRVEVTPRDVIDFVVPLHRPQDGIPRDPNAKAERW